MYYYIVLLFVVLPLVELILLKLLWDSTSLFVTLSLVLSTGFLGANLARIQGMTAWRKIHETMAAGRPPGKEMVEGVMILMAGAVLVTPGIITDAIGFLLLVPAVRRWLGVRAVDVFKKRTLAKFTVHTSGGTTETEPQPEPTIIDAEYTKVDDAE